jgi:alpha,alpha-trehalase
MTRHSLGGCLLFASALLWAPLAVAVERPSQQYRGLYERVEMQALYADSKTFADALPRMAPQQIMADYRAQAPDDAALHSFVEAHFTLPRDPPAPPALHARSL